MTAHANMVKLNKRIPFMDMVPMISF
jgi:hypothetical protein